MPTRQVPDFSHLMAPVQIGKYRCPNRVKYAACSISNFNERDGSVSERELASLKE